MSVIGTTRRTIGRISDTADVDEDEVVGSEEFSPPGLPVTQVVPRAAQTELNLLISILEVAS